MTTTTIPRANPVTGMMNNVTVENGQEMIELDDDDESISIDYDTLKAAMHSPPTNNTPRNQASRIKSASIPNVPTLP